MTELPLLLTVPQVQEALGLGRTKTLELIYRGEIPSVLIGRSRRVPRAALEKWIEQQLEEEAATRSAWISWPARR
jgi:excisionase family DNA binding protein